MATDCTRVFFVGFNLYEQIGQGCTALAESFIDFPLTEGMRMQMSHSFALLWDKSKIIVQGANSPPTIISLPDSESTSQISCSDKRILILCDSGNLFKIHLKDEVLSLPVALPKLPLDPGDKIAKIACGTNINIAISQSGAIFNIPNQLDAKFPDLIQISVGREHCLMLTARGDVFSFGRGSRGQLGHGSLEDLQEPKLMEALAGVKIVQISAGGWHSCGMSASGDLYSWGWNGNGQLGLAEDVSVMATPAVIDFGSLQTNTRRVACGSKHTVALLDNGELWGAGWNKYCQLGRTNTENCYGMRKLHDFSYKNVTDLQCGPWSTLVFVN